MMNDRHIPVRDVTSTISDYYNTDLGTVQNRLRNLIKSIAYAIGRDDDMEGHRKSPIRFLCC